MGKRQNWDSALVRIRSVCISILRHIESTKKLRGDELLLWTTALFARIIQAASSVRLLSKSRLTLDSMILIRSMAEAAISMEYIHHDASKAKEMRAILRAQGIEDEYDLLCMHAHMNNMSVERHVRENPEYANALKAYNDLKTTKLYNAGKNEWPRRWRFIGIEEKCTAVRGSKRSKEHRWIFTELGDICVHSRSTALFTLLRDTDDDTISFLGRDRSVGFSPTVIRRLAILCLLASGKTITDEYHASEEVKSRLLNIGQTLEPSVFE